MIPILLWVIVIIINHGQLKKWYSYIRAININKKDIWETTVNTIWDSQIGYSDEEVFVSVLFDI